MQTDMLVDEAVLSGDVAG